MAEVTLTVAGRQYPIHCRDGDEAHLDTLAALVDSKARQTQGTTEARQLFYAALFLADEVDTLKRAAAGRQGQLELGRQQDVADDAESGAGVDAIAQTLEAIAARVETLAESLAPAPAHP